jgi:hypothetical protein
MTSSTSAQSTTSPTRLPMNLKRPTALLLPTYLTLYPSPSPLFHLVCLPAIIHLHRHNSKLFIIHVSLSVGLVSACAHSMGSGEEGLLAILTSAVEYSGLLISAVIGSITLHHRLITSMGTRNAWSDSLLFGSIFTIHGIICRCLPPCQVCPTYTYNLPISLPQPS